MDYNLFYQINYMAVAFGAVLYFFLGALWYSPFMFGNSWAALQGINTEDAKSKNMTGVLLVTFTLILLSGFILAFLIELIKSEPFIFVEGLAITLLMFIGLVAPVLKITFLYEDKPYRLFLIDAGYHFSGYFILGTIISLWR
jgi:hypothetical protein